jgi:DNA-binding CsgD family transcriptional regulator
MRASPKPARAARAPNTATTAAPETMAPDNFNSRSHLAAALPNHSTRHLSRANVVAASSSVLAHFVIEQRAFRLVLCDGGNSDECTKAIRFRIGKHSLAIIEDVSDDIIPDIRQMVDRLTKRELQILCLIAQGCSTRNIAHRLQISEWTVNTHVKRASLKLQVGNRAAMVFYCSSVIGSLAKSGMRDPSQQETPRRSTPIIGSSTG